MPVRSGAFKRELSQDSRRHRVTHDRPWPRRAPAAASRVPSSHTTSRRAQPARTGGAGKPPTACSYACATRSTVASS